MKRRNFIWYSLLFSGGCTVANNLNNLSKKSVANLPKNLRFTVTDVNEQFQGSKMTTAVDADYDIIREVYKAIREGEFIN